MSREEINYCYYYYYYYFQGTEGEHEGRRTPSADTTKPSNEVRLRSRKK